MDKSHPKDSEPEHAEMLLHRCASLIGQSQGPRTAGSTRRDLGPLTFAATYSTTTVPGRNGGADTILPVIHTVLSSRWVMTRDPAHSSQSSKKVDFPISLAYSFSQNLRHRRLPSVLAQTPAEAVSKLIEEVINDEVIHAARPYTKEALRRLSNGQGFTLDEITPLQDEGRECSYQRNLYVPGAFEEEASMTPTSFVWKAEWDATIKEQCCDARGSSVGDKVESAPSSN